MIFAIATATPRSVGGLPNWPLTRPKGPIFSGSNAAGSISPAATRLPSGSLRPSRPPLLRPRPGAPAGRPPSSDAEVEQPVRTYANHIHVIGMNMAAQRDQWIERTRVEAKDRVRLEDIVQIFDAE